MLSVQDVHLSVKVCCLHFTIKYYYSATFLLNLNSLLNFIKVLDSLEGDRYMKKYCFYLKINLEVAVFDGRSESLVANIDDRSKF